MNIEVKKIDNIAVVAVEGDVDTTTSDTLNETFQNLLTGKNYQLVGDFAHVAHMSSAGFRVILATMKAARANGGDLRLSSVRGNVFRVLKMSGFDKFIKFFKDSEAAVNSFSREG